jgi:hypothetical protein
MVRKVEEGGCWRLVFGVDKYTTTSAVTTIDCTDRSSVVLSCRGLGFEGLRV